MCRTEVQPHTEEASNDRNDALAPVGSRIVATVLGQAGWAVHYGMESFVATLTAAPRIGDQIETSVRVDMATEPNMTDGMVRTSRNTLGFRGPRKGEKSEELKGGDNSWNTRSQDMQERAHNASSNHTTGR